MRKATTVLMTSTLILSSIFPSVIHATENIIDNGIKNTNTEVQQTTDNVENTESTNLDAGNNIYPEESSNDEGSNYSPSISGENEEQESLSNVPATSETNPASEQTPEPETSAVENDDIYASGTAGTCDWYITNEGVLHIGIGEISTLGSNFGPWYNYTNIINKIVFDGPVTSGTNNLDWLFYRLSNVTEIIGLELLDITGATRTRYMFGKMSSLKSLDISTLDTSKVWLMEGMFDSVGVEELDLTSLDTSHAIQMSSLASWCPNLKKLKVDSISIPEGSTAWSVFAYNDLLEEIDLNSLVLSESTVGGDILYKTPIKKLIVSEKTRLNNKLNLNTPPINETYTGKWQTVDSGTDEFPKGDWSGTTEELYERTQEGIADTYVWQPVLAQAEDVTIKYVDQDNKPIADDVVKTGSIGENYTSEPKEILGYTFKEVQGNPAGQFSDQAQTVVYIYTKDEVLPITGTVIVKYEDDKGNTLSDSVIKSGTVGENYTTEKKDIKGYFFKETRGDISGIFTEETQTITYVYSKDDIETEDKGNNNNILDTEGKDKIKSEMSKSEEVSVSKTDKMNLNKKNTSEENAQYLPQTGEKSSVWSLVTGLSLLGLGLYTAVFRFNSRK